MPYVETVTLDPGCENIYYLFTYIFQSPPGKLEPTDDPMCLWFVNDVLKRLVSPYAPYDPADSFISFLSVS
jgi:hypothetical protein